MSLQMTGAMVVRGDSAFAKSYVPGKGYVAAVDVPVKQLRELAHGGRARAHYQSYLADNAHKAKVKQQLEGTRAFVQSRTEGEQGSSNRRKLRPRYLTNKTVSQVSGSKATAAFAVKTGGRRDPGHVFSRTGASRETLVHEHAHVSPNRSGYRLNQILNNPRKTMREEGRADYLSGVHYKHNPSDSGYAEGVGNGERMRAAYQDEMGPKFRRSSAANYRHVQDRMQYAGTKVKKVATTMSDREAHRLAARYDTRGPLPKGLDRETKMKAYEARYLASGGRQGEKWKRRADAAEVGRNVGLAGATVSAAALLAGRGKRTGPVIARTRGLKRVTAHHVETAGLAAAAGGGASELYGEHARNRRASYANSPAGVAGSALTRMQNYTPKARS